MNRFSKVLIAAALAAGSSTAFAQDLHALNTATMTAVTAPVVAVSDRPEPNAFLRSKAMNHERLMAEIKNDPIVMGRFKRHFGMSSEGVVSMFEGLHASELKQDGVYLVYNCPESGELRAKSIFYKRGTQVWSDAMGTPVLKMSCGNPMARGSDHLQATTYTDLQASSALMPMESRVGNTEGTPLEALTPAEIPVAVAAPVAATPVSVATSHGGGAGWLAFLPLAGLGFIHSGGGGGCDTHGGCTPPPTCTGGTQCVPEPVSSVIMILGVGGIVARKFRKKS